MGCEHEVVVGRVCRGLIQPVRLASALELGSLAQRVGGVVNRATASDPSSAEITELLQMACRDVTVLADHTLDRAARIIGPMAPGAQRAEMVEFVTGRLHYELEMSKAR